MIGLCILISYLITCVFLLQKNFIKIQYNVNDKDIIVIIRHTDDYYRYMIIENLALSEGLSLKSYIDPSNNSTIGFGHAIRHGEKYQQISFNEAYEILLEDIDSCIFRAQKLGFKGCQKYAVAHMMFCFRYKTFLQIINSKKFPNNLSKYDKYYNKRWFQSDNMRKQREFEINLYNYENTEDRY